MIVADRHRVRFSAGIVAITLALCWLLTGAAASAAPPKSAGHAPAGLRLLAQRDGGQVPGMDVSAHQGNVDWAAAYRDGARFAYVKASEGTGYVNPYFAQQYNGSYEVGMIRGAYHFALPDRSTGAAQADYLIAHGGGWSADGRTMPPMLDIEYNPYGNGCFGLSPADMVAWIKDFSDEVHAKTTRWPMMYTTTDWWKTCTANKGDFSATNPLFIARYANTAGELPAKWDFYTLWQYSDSGRFPGDQDQFNGTLDRLRALAAAQPAPVAVTPHPAAVPRTPPRPSGTSSPTRTPSRSTSATSPTTMPQPSRTTAAKPTSATVGVAPSPAPHPANPQVDSAPLAVRGLIWAGANAAPEPAPTSLAPAGSPISVVAADYRAPAAPPNRAESAPPASTVPTHQPPTQTEPSSSPSVAAAPPTVPPPAEPMRSVLTVAHNDFLSPRPFLLTASLLLLGLCLLLIRREMRPRSGRSR